MLVEEIDAIGAETAQRAIHDLADMVGVTVDARDAGLAEPEPELGGDHDAVTPIAPERAQRARKQLLVLVRPVCFGRVEERHAQLDGAMDGGNGLTLIALFGRAVRLTLSLIHI